MFQEILLLIDFYNGTSDGWRMVAAPIKSATLADWDDEFIYCGIVGGSAGNNYTYYGCGNFYMFILMMNLLRTQV